MACVSSYRSTYLAGSGATLGPVDTKGRGLPLCVRKTGGKTPYLTLWVPQHMGRALQTSEGPHRVTVLEEGQDEDVKSIGDRCKPGRDFLLPRDRRKSVGQTHR